MLRVLIGPQALEILLTNGRRNGAKTFHVSHYVSAHSHAGWLTFQSKTGRGNEFITLLFLFSVIGSAVNSVLLFHVTKGAL